MPITRRYSATPPTANVADDLDSGTSPQSLADDGRERRPAARPGEAFTGLEDLEPTPNTPEHRRWRWPAFSLIWGSSTANPAATSVGAALLTLGLNWWEATVAHFIGGIVVVVALIFTAWAGTKYGIPYPVLARSSFGHNGAQLCTLTRGVVAIFWLSFQALLCPVT